MNTTKHTPQEVDYFKLATDQLKDHAQSLRIETPLSLLKKGLECGIFDDAPAFKSDALTVIRKSQTPMLELLEALKGCADMLRESAKMHRIKGDGNGHGQMADMHAEKAFRAIAQAEGNTNPL